MEPKQLVLSEAEQAPPPEPTVPEPERTPPATDIHARLDELCRDLFDPQVRSRLAQAGIEVHLARKLEANGKEAPAGSNPPETNEAGHLSDTLAEVKDFAMHIGGLERLKEMVDMLVSLHDEE